MAQIDKTTESGSSTRLQRILTAMVVGVIGASILSIVVLIASAAFKWNLFWIFGPVASIGMLTGMLLMFILMIVSIRAKISQNRSNS